MAAEMICSVFYDAVLPNSAAGALFIFVILFFRKMTKRLSKGYVRILWLLLLAELLAPPLFHGSFHTMRDLAMNTEIVRGSRTAAGDIRQAGSGAEKEALLTDADWLLMEKQNGGKHVRSEDGTALSDGAGRLSADERLSANERLLSNEKLQPDRGLQRLADGGTLTLLKIAAAGIWVIGVLVLCAGYVCRFWKLKKSVSDAVYVNGEGYWVTGQTDIPFVMPQIPPRIYLPVGLTYEKQTDILAHERQHIKNLDILVKSLAVFAAAVHWFNPFVWAACACIGKDLEMYCDECVLRGCSMAERRHYSNTLLEFAAASNGLTLTLHFGESNTEDRIRHILFLKKPRAAVSILLAVLVAICGIFFLTSRSDQRREEKEGLQSGPDAEALLAGKIRSQTDKPLLKQYYADYDGDGINEMFAVTGDTNRIGTNQIWFAGTQEVRCLMDDAEGYMAFYEQGEGVYDTDSSQKLFIMNCGTTGRLYFSKCYWVKSGEAYEAETFGDLLEQEEGTDFKVYVDAYDRMLMDGTMSGHTRKAYYVRWTGAEFEEYPAEEISAEELQKYDGAEEVLDQIDALNYTVGSVFLRSNGIININAEQDFDTGTIYENITLKLEGDTVSVAECSRINEAESETVPDILASSSYGGIYQASAFGVSGYESDAKTLFAEQIIRLVRENKKEALAELISYPIRADVDGEQTELKDAEEFVQNYDRIANETWKARVLAADTEDIPGNYMGNWIGNGAVWFEMQEGEEGRIFAINNGQSRPQPEETDTKEAWQQLALSQGMDLEESQAWYEQFLDDELYVDRYNYKITGCAYSDFDQNGTKDLFFVTSVSPQEIYPETLEWTAYIYGYMNGTLVYKKGLAAFSMDGFWRCSSIQGENGNSCIIQCTVDTDSLEETTYWLDIDMDSKTVLETALPEQIEDPLALKRSMAEFCRAYFAGNADIIRKYLSRSYAAEVTVYDRPDEADGIQIKGVKGSDDAAEENIQGACTLSLEFQRPGEDSFTYLTAGFIRENDIWKVKYYGLEK